MDTNKLTEHLYDTNMRYFDHMKFALRTSARLLAAGSLCAIHAFFPFIFVDSASKRVKQIYSKLESR